MALKLTDTIEVRTTGGGDKPYTCSLAEIEALMTTEENAALAALEAVIQTEASAPPPLPVASTLTTGAADSEIVWTADVAGTLGDTYSLTFEVPATSKLIPASGGDTYALTYTGVKGQHPISITYADGAANTVVAVTKGEANDFTVTIGTSATAAHLYTAVTTAITSGVMAGKISGVAKHASWSNAANPSAMAKDWLDATAAIAVTGTTDIVAAIKYDGETGVSTSTATDLLTAINTASTLVTGTATGTGESVVEVKTHTHLAGGVDGTVGAKGKAMYANDWLYVTPTASTVSARNWKRTPLELAAIVYLDDAAAAAAYTPALDNQTIILKEYNDKDITLPATTGSGVVIKIVNMDDATFVITPATDDAIQGSAANATWDIPTLCGVTLVDYADGFWGIVGSHGAVAATVG